LGLREEIVGDVISRHPLRKDDVMVDPLTIDQDIRAQFDACKQGDGLCGC
jgi:hypothetical protein